MSSTVPLWRFMQIFSVFPLPPTLSISTLIVVSVKPDKAPVALD